MHAHTYHRYMSRSIRYEFLRAKSHLKQIEGVSKHVHCEIKHGTARHKGFLAKNGVSFNSCSAVQQMGEEGTCAQHTNFTSNMYIPRQISSLKLKLFFYILLLPFLISLCKFKNLL